ncbi:uncharacterized protein IL334_006408 [Kwoniella shivajii]|uniref:Ras modification protein ERF4 n=1 Tax=Kwoniella shivajii TaxID=564305 RepID=A0ABZ1D735_9TREE|nr:hypothetical protein IL334_006408 [Kwoniella shivajii]
MSATPHPLSSPPPSSPSSPSHLPQTPFTPADSEGISESRPFITPSTIRNLQEHTGHPRIQAIPDSNENVISNRNGYGNGNDQSFSVIRTPGQSQPLGKGSGMGYKDWEEEYEREKYKKLEIKVQNDLKGWRGGIGQPKSSVQWQAIPKNSYFHQPQTGIIGKHLPKEMVRIERDWSDGEICKFETMFPMELEGRIEPIQMTSFINSLNEILHSAYAVKAAIWDNIVAISTLWTSLIWRQSHFEKELQRAEEFIQLKNKQLFNPNGCNVLSPRYVALQFVR